MPSYNDTDYKKNDRLKNIFIVHSIILVVIVELQRLTHVTHCTCAYIENGDSTICNQFFLGYGNILPEGQYCSQPIPPASREGEDNCFTPEDPGGTGNREADTPGGAHRTKKVGHQWPYPCVVLEIYRAHILCSASASCIYIYLHRDETQSCSSIHMHEPADNFYLHIMLDRAHEQKANGQGLIGVANKCTVFAMLVQP